MHHRTIVIRLSIAIPRPTSLVFFFFSCSGDHRDLHSFPTRRSSDLVLLERLRDVAFGLERARIEQMPGGGAEIGVVTDERSEEHTSELQSPDHLVCRLLLEKKKKKERGR